MNEVFMHQALASNRRRVEELNAHLQDLKALMNGDLAIEAAENLKKVQERVSSDISELSRHVADVCLTVVDSHHMINDSIHEMNRMMRRGWVLFVSGILSSMGLLCYLVYRVL